MDPHSCLHCGTMTVSETDFCDQTCEKKALWKSKEQELKDKIVGAAITWADTDTEEEVDVLLAAVDELEKHRLTKL